MSVIVKRASVHDTFKILTENPNAVMVDVREPDEVSAIAPALGKVLPMSELNPATFDVDCGVSKSQPLFLFCRSGNRSMRVASALADYGFTDLTNVEGGIIAWEKAGLPLKK